MRCLTKIHHRQLIYVFLFAVFSLFLSAVGSVSDSYASNGSCTVPFNRTSTSNINLSWYSNIYCDIDLYSNNWYWRISSISLDFSAPTSVSDGKVYVNFHSSSSSQSSPTMALYLNDISYSSLPYTYSHSFTHYRIFSNATVGSSDNILNNGSINLYGTVGTSTMRWTGSVVIEYTDDLSFWFGGSSGPCPPIPENPYDDKLDEIKKAIYCASAVMIMIYFFFIVYKIIVKDGGRR